MRDIAGKAQFAARFEHFGHQIKIVLRDKTALVVALFGPGVGVKNEQAINAVGGKGFKNFDGIIIMNADIGKVLFFDKHQQLGHAIEERLAAYDASVRVVRRLPGQMLATALTNFQPDFFKLVGEQSQRLYAVWFCEGFGGQGHAHIRQ